MDNADKYSPRNNPVNGTRCVIANMIDLDCPSAFSMISALFQQLSRKRKLQLSAAVSLMIITSFAEVISIGSVGPFLSVLTESNSVHKIHIMELILEKYPYKSSGEIKACLTLIFVVSALLAAGLRLLLLWATTNIAFKVGADLSGTIFRKTLHQTYATHLSRNSSEIVSAISEKTKISTEIVTESLSLISTLLMMMIIIMALAMVNPEVAFASLLVFGGIYSAISMLIKRRIVNNSNKIASGSVESIRLLQEGLGGIRDIIISNNQDVYSRWFVRTDRVVKHAQGENWFLARSPRYLMEGLGMAMIGISAYIITAGEKSFGFGSIVPLLGVVAFAAQRVLPMLQQAYYSVTFIRSNKSSLNDTLKLLSQHMPIRSLGAVSRIKFENSIELRHASFSYQGNGLAVLDDVSITIKKGMKVGIIGKSGGGKSTLIDIIMGLLIPSDGNLTVDGVEIDEVKQNSWGKCIGHVPQSIFLIDGSIEENIAFGIEEGDVVRDRIIEAARIANVHEFVSRLPMGYKTIVGERGVRLSGGQRQRIGIARALYKDVDLYVLDEATSALDKKTEEAVMEGLDAVKKGATFIIVAHRITTLKHCDIILKVEDGKVISSQ